MSDGCLPHHRPLHSAADDERDRIIAYIEAKAAECEILARKGVDPEGCHLLAHRLLAIGGCLAGGLHR